MRNFIWRRREIYTETLLGGGWCAAIYRPLVKTFNDFLKICQRIAARGARGDGSLGRKIISVITQRENRESESWRPTEREGVGKQAGGRRRYTRFVSTLHVMDYSDQ